MSHLSCKRLGDHCVTAVQHITHEYTCGNVCRDQTVAVPVDWCESMVKSMARLAASALSMCHVPLRSGPEHDTTDSSNHVVRTPVKKRVLNELRDNVAETHKMFYRYQTGAVPLILRTVYTDFRILEFALVWTLYLEAQHRHNIPEDQEQERATVDHLVSILDDALIFSGGGERRGASWLHQALELLYETWQHHSDDNNVKALQSWEQEPTFSEDEPFVPSTTHPIDRVEPISMSKFERYLQTSDTSCGTPQPLIITNLHDGWPARTTRPWNRPAYLLSRTFHGKRLIAVEIGRTYTDPSWTQSILSFGDFLNDRVINASTSRKPTGYLAQYDLFRQIPQLRADISIPDYCYTTPPPHSDPLKRCPDLDEPIINAWLGPAGTITPLHTDPYHNLLAQVVGRKYVRLYAPEQGTKMQARQVEDGVNMSNTSHVDIGVLEGWDTAPSSDAARPAVDLAAFREVPFLDCILEPGDTLYIPAGWWHYVRSLSISFSVNFWWN